MIDFVEIEFTDYEGDELTVNRNGINNEDLCFTTCMDGEVACCVLTKEQALQLAARIVEIYA